MDSPSVFSDGEPDRAQHDSSADAADPRAAAGARRRAVAIRPHSRAVREVRGVVDPVRARAARTPTDPPAARATGRNVIITR